MTAALLAFAAAGAALTAGAGRQGTGAAVASTVAARTMASTTWSAASRHDPRFFNVGATHSPELERMLAGGGTASGAGSSAPASIKAPTSGAVLGVDVASFQHPGGASIDWGAVYKAGYRFAFIKATEGSYYANPYFASDLAAARSAGLLVAAYHFANPSYSSGTLQAAYALNDTGDGNDGTTLPLILDIEYDPYSSNKCYGLTPQQMVWWIRAFTNEVHQRTGQYPVIYTTADWWKNCTGSSTAFTADPLWIAEYSSTGFPALPAGWTSWSYWQYTSTGTVPGISTINYTDISEMNLAALEVAQPAAQSDGTGQAVSLAIRSVNASAGQSLSYTATGLPPGLTIDPASGVITGTTPASPASYPVTVTVSGTGLGPVTENFTWDVHGPVQITQSAAQSGEPGSPALLQVTAGDSLSGCTLTFTASGLPPGLTISPCGRISGWLTRSGSYHPVVNVTDSSGTTLASTSFTWLVTGPTGAGPAGHIALPGRGGCLTRLPTRLGTVRCQHIAAQRWTVTKYGGLRLGRQCLAIQGTSGVTLRGCRDSAFQRWQIETGGALVSERTGTCLTSVRRAGGTAGLKSCLGWSNQSWTLPAGPLASGIAGRCASSWHPAGSPAGPVRLRTCGWARTTTWTLQPSGALRTAGGCLSITYPAVAGAVVKVAPCRGNSGQMWQPISIGQVADQFVNPHTGLCLADPGDQTGTTRLALGYCVTADPGTAWRPS